ncbi:MAG: 6-phosphogluconolactonase [Treponema sp.]|jgi:glucosamine-6-phosphate isomerase|nr:6-phosphogluconolactonase [Treponema sp.]
MKVCRFDSEALAAAHAADIVEGVLRKKPNAVFCFAAGHSSLPVFNALVERGTDFSAARFIELDEWLGLSPDTGGSCAFFLKRNFFSRIAAAPDRIALFNGMTADCEAECRRMEERIVLWGGIDCLLLGAGMNGHLALNEPGSGFDEGIRRTALSRTTLEVAPKYFPRGMPPITEGITLGLKNILACRRIQLIVLGTHKAEIVRRLLSLSAPDRDFPASALLAVPEAELLLDAEAAGR